MSYIKQSDLIDENELTMEDVSKMHMMHIIAAATKVYWYDGEKFNPYAAEKRLIRKVDVAFSYKGDNVELLEEGPDFVVIKDNLGKEPEKQILKFVK